MCCAADSRASTHLRLILDVLSERHPKGRGSAGEPHVHVLQHLRVLKRRRLQAAGASGQAPDVGDNRARMWAQPCSSGTHWQCHHGAMQRTHGPPTSQLARNCFTLEVLASKSCLSMARSSGWGAIRPLGCGARWGGTGTCTRQGAGLSRPFLSQFGQSLTLAI